MNFKNFGILVGRLTHEPELGQSGDTKYTHLAVAIDRPGTGKVEGAPKLTDFPRLTAFGKTAEFAVNHLHKGEGVMLTYEVRTRNVEGQGTVHDLIVQQIDFLPSNSRPATAPAAVAEEVPVENAAPVAAGVVDPFDQE